MQLIRLRMGSMGLLRMRSCQGALLRASRSLRPTMGSPIMKTSSQRFYSVYNMNGSHLGRVNRHYSALQLLSLRHFSQTAGRLDATKNGGNNNNNSNKNKNNKNKQEPSNPFEGWQKWVLPTLLLVLVLNGIGLSAINSGSQMTFQDFKANYLEKGLVKKVVVINGSYAQAELISGMPRFVTFTIGSPDFFDREMESIQDRLGIPNNERIPISYETRTSAWSWFVPFLPTILLIGGAYYLVMQMKKRNPRGTGGPLDSIMNVGKSKARLFNQDTDIKVKFKDVAGCDEAKAEIMEFVSFLKNPQKYEKLGAKIPRGAILSGPPGTGKTLLAKATAGEAGVPFLSVSGSEFVEMFVGVGASRVRDLFATARKLAPSIIFIDEIDAIGGAREKSAMRSNDEKEATLNQLLVEMDGFDTSDHVVVLAGTNRPDMLDKALLRPGRFDRHIYLDKPDIEGRKAIYKVHLRPLKLKEPVTDMFAGRLAAMTPGFSGADIANCCNEAALTAARHNADYVEMRDFEEAIERIIVGMERKTRVLTPVEKKTVAYHEAGHAICGWYLQYADPLLKVSIIPRGQAALGYAQYLPPDVYLISEEQFEHKMIMALGGRVSEELHFPDVTTGAADDLQKATKMANAMVLKLGMSKKLGTIIFEPKNNQMQIHKPFSEETFEEIDSEVHRLITECYKKCRKLLTEKIDDVDKVAKELLKKEVITRDDMIRLLGPRPFKEQNEAFKKYLMPAKEQQEQDHKGNENPQPASS